MGRHKLAAHEEEHLLQIKSAPLLAVEYFKLLQEPYHAVFSAHSTSEFTGRASACGVSSSHTSSSLKEARWVPPIQLLTQLAPQFLVFWAELHKESISLYISTL